MLKNKNDPSPPIQTPETHPENHEFFAFVVEGKVAVVHALHRVYMPQHVAAWSSNPRIVLLSEDQKNVVQIGWKYDPESDNFAQ